MKVVGSRIYFLAEKGVTSAVMADQIDPDRTNSNIPPVVQRTELAYGLDTPFLQRTLCTAFELVDQTHLPDRVSKDDLLTMALNIASALASIADTVKEFLAHQAETRAKKLTAAYLPHTANITGKVRQSLAHLRDVENTIKEMTLCFYPKASRNDPWDKNLRAAIEAAHNNEPEAIRHLENVLGTLLAVADHRNAMIHPDETKRIAIIDYELEARGAIVAPTIEITHARSPVPRQDIAQFLETQIESISHAYETVLAWLCDLNARNIHDMFDNHVVSLPDGEMRSGSRLVWQTVLKDGYEMGEGKIQPKA